MFERRNFLTSLAVCLAAPAIIRPGLLMPVKKKILLPEIRIKDVWNTPHHLGDHIRLYDLTSRSYVTYLITDVAHDSITVVKT